MEKCQRQGHMDDPLQLMQLAFLTILCPPHLVVSVSASPVPRCIFLTQVLIKAARGSVEPQLL
jgi:hypothetical protein